MADVYCALSVSEKTLREAQQGAYDLVSKISWDSAVYRTDIGFKALNQG